VVGFLTGLCGWAYARTKFRRFILPRLVGNLLRGNTGLGNAVFGYLAGLVGGVLRGEFHACRPGSYPAHLHINVDSAWRAQTRPAVNGNLYRQLRGSGVQGFTWKPPA